MNASFPHLESRRKRRALWRCFFAIATLVLVPSSGAAAPPVIGDDLDRVSLRRALAQSFAYLERLPSDYVVGKMPRPFTVAETLTTLRVFDRIMLERWRCRSCWLEEVKRVFDFLPSSPHEELRSILFTGYYQPLIEASLLPTADYRFPIYGKPADLITGDVSGDDSGVPNGRAIGRIESGRLVPYYSRAEIDQRGILRGRGYEIAWAKDPVEVFFLHVQGSGILRLPDGRRVHVGYAAQNGLPYRSIGRLLVDRGEIPLEEISMQRLKQYLAEQHPAERDRILAHNESYVFFRFLPAAPLGSLEVPVTAGRSIATDARLFPKGALGLMYAERPVVDGAGRLRGWTPFLRFVLNQDTGGAIKGPQRADLFFGANAKAGAQAGYMNSRGKLYFLSLRVQARGEARRGNGQADAKGR